MSATGPAGETDRLDSDRQLLRQLDVADMAAASGGLSLLPTSGHRLWRLGALATLTADGGEGDKAVTRDHLRRFLTIGPLAAMAAQQEDPFDDVLTEEIAFHGGSYLVGGGLAEESVYLTRLLLRALLLENVLPEPLRGELSGGAPNAQRRPTTPNRVTPGGCFANNVRGGVQDVISTRSRPMGESLGRAS